MFYPPKIHWDAIDKMINFLLEANKWSVLSANATAEKVEIDQFVYILASDCGLLENKLGKVSAQPHTIVKQICFPNGNVLFLSLFSLFNNWMHNVGWGCAEILPTNATAEKVEIDQFVYILASDCGLLENKLGKVSAQPHTIVKQICFPNGNVLFLSLFSLFKNWMHNVGWGCAEILPRDLVFRRYLKLYP